MRNLNLYDFFTHSFAGRLVLAVFFVSISLIVKSQDNTLVAVGNQSGTPSSMKWAELKAILMGETQRWKNGKRIIIALMKTNTPTGKTTSATIYDMSGDELNKFWLALVFQGKATAPTFFNSESDLENFVAQNPGAIGIIDKPLGSSIKIITIDGKTQFNL
ncbi:MAG: hypothetical protein ABIO76_04725 [Ginsengibacter sp.]